MRRKSGAMMAAGDETPEEQKARERLYNLAVAGHKELEIDKLLKALIKLKGSDLQLEVAKPPVIRFGGVIKALNRGPMHDEEMVRLCVPLLDQRNRQVFEETGGTEFAYSMPFEGEVWRFRVSLQRRSRQIGAAVHLNRRPTET
jgi:twitching motility protein PilT